MFDTLIRRVFELAGERPQAAAAAFREETLTYLQLKQKIEEIGTALGALGVKKGSRVAFSAVSKPEMIAIYLGIQYAGGIAVFIDKNGTPENVAAVCDYAGACLLLTDKPMKEFADRVPTLSLKKLYQNPAGTAVEGGALRAPVTSPAYVMPEESDIAELLFTTGTTGRPKGVILTYRAVFNILSNTIEGIGIRTDDRVLLPLPLNHSYALRVLRAVLYRGAAVVLQNGFTFAREIENNMTRWQCTALAAVPASIETVRMQMQDKFAAVLGSLRYIEVGAGSLTVRQRRWITETLPNTVVYNTWGSSETGGALFLNVTEAVKDEKRILAVGHPLPCVEVRVLDPDGNPMESDEAHPGRMALRGGMIMDGYWGQEELTKETLRDGWLLTGDMVYTDADGFVYMLGRADDIINVGGEKVSPIDVENVAGQYPDIRECACIGAADPDGILGQIPVLFVVPAGTFREEEMRKYLSQRMERYKLPQRYVVLEEIPRNRMKKIDRRALRQIWSNQDTIDLLNPVMQTILGRRSIRRFTAQPIPGPVLDMILKAGYHAPTGHNMQSWQFTVLEKPETIARLKAAMQETAAENKVYFYGFDNPQAVVLISNDRRNPDGCQDASAAAENMFLAARSYGVGSAWINALMTLRDEEPAKSLLDELGVPAGHTVWCTAVFGYPVADAAGPAKKTNVIRFADR